MHCKLYICVSTSLHSLRQIEFKTCCCKQKHNYCTSFMLPYQIRGFRCNASFLVACVGLITEPLKFLSSWRCWCRGMRYTCVRWIALPTIFSFWGGASCSLLCFPLPVLWPHKSRAIFATSILRFEELLPSVQRSLWGLRFISNGSVDQRSACACVCVFVYVLIPCPSPFLLFLVQRWRELRGLLHFFHQRALSCREKCWT